MTYWHMQLHPNDKNKNEEYDILNHNIIGLGDWDDKKPTSQIRQFKEEMNIGDIVLIKRGEKPLALVKVLSESKEGDGVGGNDWIYYARDVEVLDRDVSNMPSFPQPRGTLQKSINKYTRTYQYIDSWYQKILNPNTKDVGFKIREVFIESDYKMFGKNFHIDFLDENKQPQPLIIIAGKNGTGKTTLLECIKNRDHSRINFQIDGTIIDHGSNSYDMTFIDKIIYLDAMVDNDSEIEQLILDYIDYFIYDRNENAVIGIENLQEDMDSIFDGFDLNFYFKKIDYKTKKPIFSNEDSIRDDIEFSLNGLSTGEKTLLSKMLYLHLKEPKNKVILIDEPETSLHPSWQNKIIKFYENFAKINNNQIIIATHSPQVIASAKNEYLRILRKNEEGNIEVVNDLKAHGRDINSILFDVMGEVAYRPEEFDDKIDRLHISIDNRKIEEALKRLEELKKDYGENDEVVMEAQMLIDMFSRNEA